MVEKSAVSFLSTLAELRQTQSAFVLFGRPGLGALGTDEVGFPWPFLGLGPAESTWVAKPA